MNLLLLSELKSKNDSAEMFLIILQYYQL